MMSDQGPYTVPLSVGPSTVGGPIYFTHGPFAGKTVRTSAAELQKADAGRKFARKDKRPLDPPPVVQVRFFELVDAGTSRQREKEVMAYDDDLTLGLVCQVDLFPVVIETGPDAITRDRAMTDLLAEGPLTNFTPSTVDAITVPRAPPPLQPSIIQTSSVPVLGWQESGTSNHLLNTTDIIAYYGLYPIRESSNSTGILAGARVSTPITIGHNNRRMLAFAFSDLAVQQEGTFTLRYRICDILSKTAADGRLPHRVPVLATCFGGVFRVWSTKTFPGLAGSTVLTKRLSLLGAPVNIRSADHKIGKGRKKQKTTHPESPAESTASPQSQPEGSEAVSSPEDRVSISPGRTPNLEWAQAGHQWPTRPDPRSSRTSDQV